MVATDNCSTLSVVVPAYNAERTIEKCLRSITRAFPCEKEIIVVDDGSTDRTFEIASKYPVKLLHHDHNRGAAAARNLGLVQASGSIVAFVDSDCVVENNYFDELISAVNYTPGKIGGVGGIVYSYDSGLISESFNVMFAGCSPSEEKRVREIDRLSGAASAYPKKVLLEIGGYDESIGGGEDLDLNIRIQKAGYKLLVIPSAKVRHFHPAELKQLAKKWFNYGKLLVAVSAKNGLKRDVALSWAVQSLGWVSCCLALLVAGLLTEQLPIWLLLVLAFCAPWVATYGRPTVRFWIRSRQLKYLIFPIVHQIVIVSRSLGVVVAAFNHLFKN